MALTKTIGYGTTISYSANGSDYTVCGSIVEGISITSSYRVADTTVLADSVQTDAPVDMKSEASFEIAYDSADLPGTQTLVDYYNAKTVLYWKVTYTNTDTEVFQGFMKDFNLTIGKAEMNKASVVVSMQTVPGFSGSGS